MHFTSLYCMFHIPTQLVMPSVVAIAVRMLKAI